MDEENKTFGMSEILEMVKKYPNNYVLGKQIRELVSDYEKAGDNLTKAPKNQ